MKGETIEVPLPPSTGATRPLAVWKQNLKLMIHENHWNFRSPYCSHCGQYQHFNLIALGQEQGHDSQLERCLCTTFPTHLPWCNQSLTSIFLRKVHVSFRMCDLPASAMQMCRASQMLLDLSVWTASDIRWVQTWSWSFRDTDYYRDT